jgi:hypothetical protein
MAKSRKPAIEIAGRASVSGGRKPKSPLDDFAKWATKQGLKITKAQVKDVKRYARGGGYARGQYHIDDDVTKAARAAKGGKRGKYLNWKDKQLAEKQEKNSRTYGDSRGPLDYWEGRLGGRPYNTKNRKEYNKRFSAAYRAEEEIGRRQGKATAKATKRYVTRKSPKKK